MYKVALIVAIIFVFFLPGYLNKELHYKIDWPGSLPKELDSKFLESALADDEDESSSHRLLDMVTSHREKYRCVLPSNHESSDSDANSSSYAELNPYKLLKPLFESQVCSFRLEQYWSYKLCHGRQVRQFHHEHNLEKSSDDSEPVFKVIAQEYLLGEYDLSQLKASEDEYELKQEEWKRKGKKRPTVLVDGIHLPYIEINMTGGTTCDLNEKPRFTRVLYVCNDDARHELSSIKETVSCEYEAIVLTPLLCKHPSFRNDADTELPIKCYSVEKSRKQPKGMAQFAVKNRTKPLHDSDHLEGNYMKINL